MFDGPDDLLSRTPVAVMRLAMDEIEKAAGIGHLDYELNAALKNSEKGVVTALGTLIFHEKEFQPFTCMISAA